LMVAIIGGEPRRFRPLIDLYRETGKQQGTQRTNSRSASICSAMSAKPRRRLLTPFTPATPRR
jgi:hypothetical protein